MTVLQGSTVVLRDIPNNNIAINRSLLIEVQTVSIAGKIDPYVYSSRQVVYPQTPSNCLPLNSDFPSILARQIKSTICQHFNKNILEILMCEMTLAYFLTPIFVEL